MFGVGKRVFDVLVEGRLRINDLNIYKIVGARRALVKSLAVAVTDGRLDMELRHVLNNPKISAIELIPAP